MAQNITRSNHPTLTKCLTCPNLISDVNQKTIARLYCDNCRGIVNKIRTSYRDKLKKNLKARPCATCKKYFIPKKKNTTLYCSRLCNIRALNHNKINIICGNCGIETKCKSNMKYCSKRCRMINHHRTKLKELENVRN